MAQAVQFPTTFKKMVVGGGVRSPARLGIDDQRVQAQSDAAGPVERRLLMPGALAPAFTTLPAELVRREVLAHLAARDLAAGGPHRSV